MGLVVVEAPIVERLENVPHSGRSQNPLMQFKIDAADTRQIGRKEQRLSPPSISQTITVGRAVLMVLSKLTRGIGKEWIVAVVLRREDAQKS